MTRSELQQLSELRLADAQVMLDGQRWAAADYLLGYAVKCARKVGVARRFVAEDVPDKSLVNDFHTHRLDILIKVAQLDRAFEERIAQDAAFKVNWTVVSEWNETVRYNSAITEDEVRDLLSAVSNPTSGVLTWLKTLY